MHYLKIDTMYHDQIPLSKNQAIADIFLLILLNYKKNMSDFS